MVCTLQINKNESPLSSQIKKKQITFNVHFRKKIKFKTRSSLKPLQYYEFCIVFFSVFDELLIYIFVGPLKSFKKIVILYV